MEKTPDKNNLLQSHSHVIPIVPCSHVMLLLWPTCKHSDQIRSAMLSVQSVTQNSYAGDGDSTPKSQTEIALRNSLEASGKDPHTRKDLQICLSVCACPTWWRFLKAIPHSGRILCWPCFSIQTMPRTHPPQILLRFKLLSCRHRASQMLVIVWIRSSIYGKYRPAVLSGIIWLVLQVIVVAGLRFAYVGLWISRQNRFTPIFSKSPWNSIQHTPSEEFQLGIMPKCLRIHGKYYSKGTWRYMASRNIGMRFMASENLPCCNEAKDQPDIYQAVPQSLWKMVVLFVCTKVSKNVQSNAIRALATTQRNVQISNQPSVEAHMPWKGTFGTHPVLAANDFGALVFITLLYTVWMSWIQSIFVAFRFLY